ncbi:MAG: adenylate kinase [Firmicutes bacterium]|jgi:adenylate kinase|nr:adenylate kinase [Bacillota bacterium]
MFVVLMGPPGAGKGTQAEKLCKEFGLIHVATGDIFRNAVKEGTEMGKKAKAYMDKGELVPDEIVLGIVKERLSKADCANGVVLDGFPRTIQQAEALDQVLEDLKMKINMVIILDINEDEVIDRLTGRRVCSNCGATYHIKYNPPKVRNICDYCSGELQQRSDDTIETVKDRIKIYNNLIPPLIDYYEQKGLFQKANGSNLIDCVFAEIDSFLQKKVYIE